MEETKPYIDSSISTNRDYFIIHGCGKFSETRKILTRAEAALLYTQLHSWLFPNKESAEFIVCAAIWYKEYQNKSQNKKIEEMARPSNIEEGIVICGWRHPTCMYTFNYLTGKRSVFVECGKKVEGFLTSKNRFVDREEGAKIHTANGGKLNYSTKDFYSEDLY